ncbi:hypothetical protein PENSPDRAFT_195908 [Peniophora sp. CONT]|nr:hypothetical protein PENSPDRAFT_195908 [Peniophora sp. CONT]
MQAQGKVDISHDLSESSLIHNNTTLLWTSLTEPTIEGKMLHIVRLDPGAAIRLVRESCHNAVASETHGIGNIETLVAMVQVVNSAGRAADIGLLRNLHDAGLLIYLRECVSSATFLVMPESGVRYLYVTGILQLFHAFLTSAVLHRDRSLLMSVLDELSYEPWASLWSEHAVITRSDFMSDMLHFLAYSGTTLGLMSMIW